MEIAHYIDHTLLRADAHQNDIKQLCAEALQHRFAAVCVSPYFVGLAVDTLRESGVKVATVVGFPMGYSPIATKVDEIKRVLYEDVDEIDAVANISAVKNGNWKHVRNDIESMLVAAHWHDKTFKLIIETGLLNNDEIIALCEIAAEQGVDYVKTSTGMLGNGATPEMIGLLRAHLPPKIKIKASGGITNLAQATALIHAGANRIGTSKAIAIMAENLLI